MIVKPYRDRSSDIEALTALAARRDCRPRGIESPIEQNHRHVKVLESILGSSILPLPTRLGIPLRATIRSVVLVSAQARITRPKQAFAGLETVIKADQLRTTINRAVDAMGVGETFMKATKIIGVETLREFASGLAKLHRPQRFDWPARFGMSAEEPPPNPVASASVVQLQAASSPVPTAKISSSKLASLLGFPSARVLLERLVADGLLVATHDGHALTEAGRAAGGEFIEKSRYGPYFVWPSAMRRH